ncbi:hypothetical protein QQ045_028532 [Rhodiola kirilowii]
MMQSESERLQTENVEAPSLCAIAQTTQTHKHQELQPERDDDIITTSLWRELRVQLKGESSMEKEVEVLSDKIEGELAVSVKKEDELQDGKKDFQRRKCDRFRIEVDINTPLRTGVYLLEEESKDPIWIDFRYERLPNICSRCGRLSHEMNECSYKAENPSSRRKFEPHLRADYQRPADPNRSIVDRRCALIPSTEATGENGGV